MRDGHVFEGDVEFVGALEQVCANAVGDGFALGDELGGVELRDDGFEDFVADGGEHALVVVEAEILWSCALVNCHRMLSHSKYVLVHGVRGRVGIRTW